jgi:hypothetical protein
MRTILSCLILMCLTAIPLADTPLQPAVAGREGRLEEMLKDISAMVLTVIPKDSVWRRFAIKRDRAQEGVLNRPTGTCIRLTGRPNGVSRSAPV